VLSLRQPSAAAVGRHRHAQNARLGATVFGFGGEGALFDQAAIHRGHADPTDETCARKKPK
jgi:hypothetical protein